jgi:predicted nuclease of predicted toxin-antitoxin system
LRAKGYEVLAVGEVAIRSVDRELIDQAHREKRVLITEDKDFGWLVFASHADTAGVILIRFPGNARSQLAKIITNLVKERGEEIIKAFVVVQPGQIRISRPPT